MNRIDLTPAPRRHEKVVRTRLRWWVIGLTAYAALLAVVYCVHVFASGVVSKVLAEERAQLTATINASSQLVTAVRQELAREQRKLQAARSVGRQPDWGILLGLLANSLGDELVLESCRLRRTSDPMATVKPPPEGQPGPGGEQLVLEIAGCAQSHEAISQFILRLEQTRLFSEVRLVRTQNQSFRDRTVLAFRLECTIRGNSQGQRE